MLPSVPRSSLMLRAKTMIQASCYSPGGSMFSKGPWSQVPPVSPLLLGEGKLEQAVKKQAMV